MALKRKALITGFSGFVGKHLKNELCSHDYEVCTTDIANAEYNVDLLDFKKVIGLIEDVKPDIVFHLAGQSSVGVSWEKPQFTFDVNVKGSINLFESVRATNSNTRIVVVGSSEQYGKVESSNCPIKETQMLKPQNPYAVSKHAQEQMALLYFSAYKMDVVLTRSFNHTGEGQQLGFALPDFAHQIAQIEKGADPIMYVGNLAAKRDISSVLDVVCAYRMLGEKGKSGEVYNVGSNAAYSMEEMLDILIELSAVKPKVIVDKEKFRPIDVPLVVCDISKLKKDTGFSIKYSIKETLLSTLNFWRDKQN